MQLKNLFFVRVEMNCKIVIIFWLWEVSLSLFDQPTIINFQDDFAWEFILFLASQQWTTTMDKIYFEFSTKQTKNLKTLRFNKLCNQGFFIVTVCNIHNISVTKNSFTVDSFFILPWVVDRKSKISFCCPPSLKWIFSCINLLVSVTRC